MNSTTSQRRRRGTHAAALTLAAVMFGAAACGTETASDVAPAAPAPAPQVQSAPHLPMSADAAERQGASARRAAQAAQEEYLRHLRIFAERPHPVKLRRSHMQSPSGRDIPLP
jgi:hypothetical protein